ncbi:hypothetical protein D8I35_04955 [Corticibacter populi]|uniref:Glycosyltransferase n=1 Tax=Corticibacter populi TaxID=1550736 RepID=A0A3M6QZI1_9BURK|nr:hypothetical protein [Corticibacter populi]RMX08434.1 hypothetical protein D8I35_04955 [Corticibacter populi]RZS35741.1 4-amino-4-deoxy-L-arabinose transferase-like glycosyltransferase [Corticibacter populi]
MKFPSPALVSQSAVRRLPRPLLWLLCVLYVLAGFIGRHPWKNEDVLAYGFMQALAQGKTRWLSPELLGLPLEPASSLLPIWLGAAALQLRPQWLDPELAVRIPFMLLVLLSFMLVWWATYFLARTRDAQPVPFAFGGEASPVDYGRAIADGSVLALIACLGFAQFSHETTASVVLLAGASHLLLAFAMGFYHPRQALLALLTGSALLVLSGGMQWLAIMGIGAALLSWWMQISHPFDELPGRRPHAATQTNPVPARWHAWPLMASIAVLLSLLAGHAAGLWHGLLQWPDANLDQWRSRLRLLVWFGWPVWPLCLWALWRWRRQIFNRTPSLHLVLPGWLGLVALLGSLGLYGSSVDRALFIGLPMAATLAAFALPTMRRSVSSLIDWFTLIFFTVCGITIWVVWTATQTGVPAKPAANVARLAPEYVPQFSWLAFLVAAAITIAWLAVVVWRTGRHRSALWKSLVLPASGATWCLVLVMSLWLPMLDYGRSYQPQIDKLAEHVPADVTCIQPHGLRGPQLAAFSAQTDWPLRPQSDTVQAPGQCTMSMVAADQLWRHAPQLLARGWQQLVRVERPTSQEAIVLFVPAAAGATPAAAATP